MGKKNKQRNQAVLIIVLLAASFLTYSYITSGDTNYIISGYGGIVSDIINVQHTYTNVDEYNEGLNAGVDPIWGGGVTPDPTGVRCEVQGKVNIAEERQYLDDVTKTINNGDGTYTTKVVEASIAKCTMGVTIRTEGTGLDAIDDVTFTIRLTENDFDIFSEADAVEAYILEVYTLSAVNDESGLIQIVPESGGYTFPMTSLSTESAPQWIIDAGYQSHVSKLKSISFNVKVDKAQPSSFLWNFRGEVTASLEIGIDILVFGYWEETGTNKDWQPPPDDKTLLDIMLDTIEDIANLLTGPLFLVVIIVVGVVIVVLVVRFGVRRK